MSKVDYIILADDEQLQRDSLATYLQDHDLAVETAANGSELLKHIDDADPSLVILDHSLGQEDGLDVLRNIRARSDVPIIIVADHQIDAVDRIVGLELGADDYMQKPVNPRELLARIRAMLRRQEISLNAHSKLVERGGYLFAGWRLTKRSRALLNPAEQAVPLTKAEYALLVAFLTSPQRPLTREYLMQATRLHDDMYHRSIDVQVMRLRRKLTTDPGSPELIQTERGIGYSFTQPVDRF